MVKSLYSKIQMIKNYFNNDNKLNKSLEELHLLKVTFSNLHPYMRLHQYTGKGKYKDIRAKQVSSEIIALYDFISSKKPRIICEIGTYKGGTLYLWTQVADKNSLIVSMDLAPGLKNAYSSYRQLFYQQFANNNQIVFCLPGDSHENATNDKLKIILGNRKIDFLFIDGDHSYQGVKKDFEMYAPLVKDKGHIAFHDILPRPEFENIQVFRLWNEIKDKYDYQEFIDNTAKKKVGIGLIEWTHSINDHHN